MYSGLRTDLATSRTGGAPCASGSSWAPRETWTARGSGEAGSSRTSRSAGDAGDAGSSWEPGTAPPWPTPPWLAPPWLAPTPLTRPLLAVHLRRSIVLGGHVVFGWSVVFGRRVVFVVVEGHRLTPHLCSWILAARTRPGQHIHPEYQRDYCQRHCPSGLHALAVKMRWMDAKWAYGPSAYPVLSR